jgi:uncharacterized protein (TIGR03435 family)
MRSAIVLLAVAALRFASAQQTGSPAAQDSRPGFAVASVKRTDLSLGQQIDMKALPGGTLTATAVTLKFLITVAYGVQNVQISGGPGWIDTEKFDILAKPAEGQKLDVRPMLQSLLEDRFQLVVRHESKDQQVYELVQKKPGQLGPGLKPSEIAECPTAPREPGAIPCGGFLLLDGRLTGQRVTLGNLGSPLSRIVGRTVMDATGISSTFDVTVEWTPDGRAATKPDEALPSIFTALEEQLGLKLQPAKRPLEMLVIERAEKPSVN